MTKDIKDDSNFLKFLEDYYVEDSKKKVSLKMNLRTAAAVRQILFEAQRGYTYNEQSVPPRISEIRSVIANIDASISSLISEE